MTNESKGAAPTAQVTLGDALSEYLHSLKPDLRHEYEMFVRKYVEHVGPDLPIAELSGSKVESYAEFSIKHTDPNAGLRVTALKAWFQFLKKKNYAAQNYGIHIRVRRPASARIPGATQVRLQAAPIEMTSEGIDDLRREFEELEQKIPDLIRAVEVARSDGDLRENAPYHAAREALAFADNRKKQVEEALKRAVVVDRSAKDQDLASVGSTVTVTFLDRGVQMKYQLVGPREANAAEKRISVDSPVGKVLLGCRVGQEVAVEAPQGVMRYRIDEIA
ncbi:MAG TPA: transcription elongation factor GreA [Tepidiformaceae bacterium]|nr:transcription elongation factor GreA [Tepidiformaceae bacterium]HMO95963.1 transcription elongation factor GreA [Tepidiformaceae bacterium]